MVKAILNKMKKKIIIASVILLAIIIFFSFFAIKIQLDIAMIIFGIAFMGLVYVLYIYAQYKIQPKKTVTIVNRVKLTSPPRLLNSIMTYKLTIEVIHQQVDKGELSQTQMDTIKLSFNKKDHPDVYNYCLNLVKMQSLKSLTQAKLMYPEAEIITGDFVLPEELVKID